MPADAEIVLEGYIEKSELTQEGPFGDHTGYYTPAEEFPVFNVTAITMRKDAIYPSIVVGKPPQEDAWLGKATERIFLPAVRMTVPEIVDYDLPVAGAFHNLAIVSIKKAFPGHARKVMHAIWGLGMLSLTKGIVIVDEHVDVHDYNAVMFYVGANVDPKRDIVITRGAARPPRPRADAAVPRRQDRDRRDGQGPTRGRARMAAGDRDGRRDEGARRPPLGGIRVWGRFLQQGTAGSVRVRAGCYDVDQLRPRPLESRLEAPWRTLPTTRIRTFRARASGRSASPSASWCSLSA